MFKVAIVGGEGFGDYEIFEQDCIKCLRKKGKEGCGIMIYTTGDKFNDRFAMKFGVDLRYFNTEWQRFGQDALKERNMKMLENLDAVIAFEDGLKDTEIFLDQAKDKKIPYRFFSKDNTVTKST